MQTEPYIHNLELKAFKAKDDVSLPKLPIHPPIRPDESGIGYLMRLDEINDYRGYLLRKHPNKDVTALLRRWQQGLSSQLTEQIEAIGPHHLVSKIRYCPHCHREGAYLKAEWLLSYSVVCRKHQVELIDHCGGCLEVRDRHGGLSAHTRCGFNYGTVVGVRTTDELQLLQRFVMGDETDIQYRGMLGHGFSELSLHERLHVLDTFVWVASAKRIDLEDLQAEAAQCSVSWMRNILKPVANAIAKESGFIRFLNFLSVKGASQYSGDREFFQHFYNQLFNRMQHSCFDRFKQLLEAYIHDSWQRTLTKRNKHLSSELIYNHPWLSLTDACRIFDLSRSSVLFAIKTNMIGYQIAKHDGRVTYTVYRPDLLSRREEIAERVTAVEAAAILGVTKKQFLKFRQMGLFKRVTPPQKEICSHWSYSRSELEQFIAELCDCPVTTSFNGQISLSKAMRLYWRQLDAGVADMAMLIKQQLVAAKRCPTQTGLRQLVVDQASLGEVLAGNKVHDILTVPELAKVLKINEEFTYQLVNLGLLACQTDQSRHARVIAHEQLEDFKQRFVLLSKLSKCLGLNSRDLMRYFAAKGVYPVGHNRPRQLRQKVYIREQIWHLGLVMNCVKNQSDWLV